MNFEEYNTLGEDGSEQFIPESIMEDLLEEVETDVFFR